MEDSEKLAFWGIALKPGETAELDLEDGETLHVSMASFGVELADKHGRSVVTATIRNSEDEGEPEKKYALCALTGGKSETVCMDVSFIGEESVTFEVTGKNIVHLVGNFSFENDLDSDSDEEDDGSNLIGVYDDDNDMSDEEAADEENMPRLIMDKDPPVITELSDDEEQPAKDKKTLVAKKKAGSSSKVANGKHTEPSSKKESKGSAGKVSKELAKKDRRKVKVDEPLNDDEAEEEDESEDESDDESDEGDEDVEIKPAKQDKEANSEDDDDESEMEEDDEDESEDESDSEDDEAKIKLLQRELSKVSKKTKGGKPSVVFKEVPSQSAKNEEKATPKSGKSKRHRKRGVSIDVPDGVTPPQNKKTKISERPGTPAASKGGSKGKAGGGATPKSGGKGTKHGAAGSSSGKNVASVPNGVTGSPMSTPPPKDNTPTAGAGTSGRKRRRKSRKSRNSS